MKFLKSFVLSLIIFFSFTSCNRKGLEVNDKTCSGKAFVLIDNKQDANINCLRAVQGDESWKSYIGIEKLSVVIHVHNSPEQGKINGFFINVKRPIELNKRYIIGKKVDDELPDGIDLVAGVYNPGFTSHIIFGTGWIKFYNSPENRGDEISFEFDINASGSNLKGYAEGTFAIKSEKKSFLIPSQLKKNFAKPLQQKSDSQKNMDENDVAAKKTEDSLISENQSLVKIKTERRCHHILERDYARMGGAYGSKYYFLASDDNTKTQSKYTLFEYDVDINKIKPVFAIDLGPKNILNVSEHGIAAYTLTGLQAVCGTGTGVGVVLGSKIDKPFKVSADFSVSPFLKSGYYGETTKKYIYFVDANTKQKNIITKFNAQNSILLSMNYDQKKLTYLLLGEKPKIVKETLMGVDKKYNILENESVLVDEDDVYFIVNKVFDSQKFLISRLDANFKKTRELKILPPKNRKLKNINMISLSKYHKLILHGKNSYISQSWGGIYLLDLKTNEYFFMRAPKETIIGKIIKSPNQKFLVVELLNRDHTFVGAGIIDLKKRKLMRHSFLN